MSLGLSDSPPSDAPEARLGQVLAGRYRLSSVLGAGAVGVVYAATDTRDDAPLALKVLAAHDDLSGQTLRRFQREGTALQKLDHPNVVRVFDAGTHEPTQAQGGGQALAYIAMERLSGETLAERIDREGALSPELCEHIAAEVLSALAYAHELQVVHRDLKPSNIFLSGDDERPAVKLLDFGLAKFLEVEPADISQTLTQSGMVLGTPLYMAPEQCTGDRVDARVDVYAAGCLLYEMITGEPPFLAESQAEVVRAHLVTPAPTLPGDGDDGSRTALSAVMAQAMGKRPEERFADAGEMLAALKEAFEERSGIRTIWQASSSERVAARPRPDAGGSILARGKRRWVAVAAVLAALALGQLIGGDEEGASSAATPAGRIDLWEERGVPEDLAAIHAKVSEGNGITKREVGRVRRFARAHRGDPRPFLLLARGFLNQGWRKDAIVRYRRAFEVDPTAVQHAPMLADLIDIAEGEKNAELAADAIVEIYGADAATEVATAMSGRPKASPEHQRLAELSARLEKKKPKPTAN
ncbi:MAG: serine/threonine-protein kinase [Myxococcales bacterium]|nr:serine/threonine-protein kinase [Myxococcales bacterium]